MESFLKPMLCGKADVVPEGREWISEGKFDGWRAVAHYDGKQVQLYCGRNGSSYTGKLPYIDEVLVQCLPPDSAVDGELLGGEWGDVQGVMTRGDGPHVPSEHVPALTYVVFDATRIAGHDIRHLEWIDRRSMIEQAFMNAGDLVKVSPVGESTPEALDKMLALGLEGLVCKRQDGRYENKRSNLWVKIKPQDTEDGEITGFYDATPGSKYEGWAVGGLCFKLGNGYEGRAAGMDDELRAAMYAEPERFIGRTVELKHHGVQAKTGALRHPNFFRFRDDLDSPKVDPHGRIYGPKTAPRVAAGGKPRNYGAMGDKKLLACIESLKAGSGDAYDRCMNGGSGNPEADLAAALGVAESKGLV